MSENSEESYTVRAARLKMEACQRNGGQGFQEAEIAYFQAKNKETRERYLKELEEKKHAAQVERETLTPVQVKAQQEAERLLKATYLIRWKASGGDEAGFNASWEAIKAEHYKQTALDAETAQEQRIRAATVGRL